MLSPLSPSHTEPVALFLSRLLPPHSPITISAGAIWPRPHEVFVAETDEDAAVLQQILADSGAWYERWGEVQRVLPMLVRLREEERARSEGLEREVEY